MPSEEERTIDFLLWLLRKVAHKKGFVLTLDTDIDPFGIIQWPAGGRHFCIAGYVSNKKKNLVHFEILLYNNYEFILLFIGSTTFV